MKQHSSWYNSFKLSESRRRILINLLAGEAPEISNIKLHLPLFPPYIMDEKEAQAAINKFETEAKFFAIQKIQQTANQHSDEEDDFNSIRSAYPSQDTSNKIIFENLILIAVLEAYYDYYNAKIETRKNKAAEINEFNNYIAFNAALAEKIAFLYHEIYKLNNKTINPNRKNNYIKEVEKFKNEIIAQEYALVAEQQQKFEAQEKTFVNQKIQENFQGVFEGKQPFSLVKFIKPKLPKTTHSQTSIYQRIETEYREIVKLRNKFDSQTHLEKKLQLAQQLAEKYEYVQQLSLQFLLFKNVSTQQYQHAAAIHQRTKDSNFYFSKLQLEKNAALQTIIAAGKITYRRQWPKFWLPQIETVNVDIMQLILSAKHLTKLVLSSAAKASTDEYTKMMDVYLIEQFNKMSDEQLIRFDKVLANEKTQNMISALNKGIQEPESVSYFSQLAVPKADATGIFNHLTAPLSMIINGLNTVMNNRKLPYAAIYNPDYTQCETENEQALLDGLEKVKTEVFRVAALKENIAPQHLVAEQLDEAQELAQKTAPTIAF